MNPKDKKMLTQTMLRTLRGKTPRERLLHRLHSVVLVLKGQSASEVARIHGDSPRAVAYWVSRFNDEGLKGLEDTQRPGRPSKLDTRQMEKLQTFVKRSKQQSKAVNAETLAAFILTEFEISLTPRQCWRILNRIKS
jgi:transposase